MKSCPTGQVHGHSKELPHRALGPAPACFKEDKGRGPLPTLEAQSLHVPSQFQSLKYFFGWQRDCDWRHSVLHYSLRQAMTMVQGQLGQRGQQLLSTSLLIINRRGHKSSHDLAVSPLVRPVGFSLGDSLSLLPPG